MIVTTVIMCYLSVSVKLIYFLNAIKNKKGSFKGVDKATKSLESSPGGYLDGFFKCIMSK